MTKFKNKSEREFWISRFEFAERCGNQRNSEVALGGNKPLPIDPVKYADDMLENYRERDQDNLK